VPTELLYLRDAYLTGFSGSVVDVRNDEIQLDATAFYPTSGGQPNDTGRLYGLSVVDVSIEGDVVWHRVEGGPRPVIGETVTGTIEWKRRHALMRTHTAMHVLAGVLWNEWNVPLEEQVILELSGRADIAIVEQITESFLTRLESLVNDEILKDRPIELRFLPWETVKHASDLSGVAHLQARSATEIRVVDIVGLDQQADDGTHVRSTAEIGPVRIARTDQRVKGLQRLRFDLPVS
jgi:misacylated tRNA(Ala) deacylase